MSRGTAPEPPRLLPLDGVRGLAVLAVVGAHVASHFHDVPAATPGRVLIEVLGAGWFGVDLFFALSGFLITSILRQTRSAPDYYTSFFARRALRIFPLYYCVILLVFVVFPAAYPQGIGRLARDWLWFATYTDNLNPDCAREGGPFFVSHLWSLAVEEQFYLVWPVAVRVLSLPRLACGCGLLVALAPVVRFAIFRDLHDPGYAHGHTLGRCDALAFGALLALLVEWRGAVRPRWPVGVALVGAFAPLALAFIGLREGANGYFGCVWAHSLASVASTALVALALTGGAPARLLSWAPLVLAGRYSYGIYVWHGLFASQMYAAGLGLRGALPTLWLAVPFYFAMWLGFASVLAVVSYHVLEEPVLRLKRYFRRDPGRAVG